MVQVCGKLCPCSTQLHSDIILVNNCINVAAIVTYTAVDAAVTAEPTTAATAAAYAAISSCNIGS